MEWNELQKMLEEHYAPAASSLAHRLDFYRREQKPGETINDYLTNLRDIAAGCKFENVEITLRDRIVVGKRDLRLQRKLITKKSISLKVVMEEARAAEISEKPAAKIEKSEKDIFPYSPSPSCCYTEDSIFGKLMALENIASYY
ncbi:hypothetical protein E2320_015515 [Naja naja]|nr:hypothetical protein E2320_015515 [Naja naja]